MSTARIQFWHNSSLLIAVAIAERSLVSPALADRLILLIDILFPAPMGLRTLRIYPSCYRRVTSLTIKSVEGSRAAFAPDKTNTLVNGSNLVLRLNPEIGTFSSFVLLPVCFLYYSTQSIEDGFGPSCLFVSSFDI